MRQNTCKVTTAFLLGAKKGKLGDSISTDGRSIFSYQTKIAERNDTLDTIRVSNVKFSATITRQQNNIRAIIQHDLPRTKIIDCAAESFGNLIP